MYSPELPQPILFHPLKHHVGYVRQFVQRSERYTEAELQAALRTVGASQLDFYVGTLTVQEIAEGVLARLPDLRTEDSYRLYLAATGTDYRTAMLSDGSGWVLRWGTVADRYVHLHPARYSAYTLRVKANTLKTAVATLVAAKRGAIPEMNLKYINQVRAAWLDLPPLQALLPDEGVGKLLTLLGA